MPGKEIFHELMRLHKDSHALSVNAVDGAIGGFSSVICLTRRLWYSTHHTMMDIYVEFNLQIFLVVKPSMIGQSVVFFIPRGRQRWI